MNFSFIKKLYKNGSLKIGSHNLYGVWNNLVFKLYSFLQTNIGNDKNKTR
jgi:hypothetical protein